MTAVSRKLCFRLLAAGLGSCVWALPAPAQSVFDDVDECDLLAAHPADPERLADGVADDAIVPRLAITACRAAVDRVPDAPRFAFQLGRAYLAAGHRQDAAAQFQKAADQDYGAGYAYLGDAYQFGHGVASDVDKSLNAYRKAVAKGFTPAEGQIEMLTFDAGNYVLPALGLVYKGDLASLRSGDSPPLWSYLFGFVLALNAECDVVLTPKAVEALYNRRYPKTWTAEADSSVQVGVVSQLAEYDARLFLRRHGCDGPVAGRMKEHLNRLFLGS